MEGFDSLRICRPWDVPDVPARLKEYLDNGRHGQMEWLAAREEWRGNPAALWPEAQSVIMLGESYMPEHDPMTVLGMADRGAISVYAQNRDYHEIVKKRLKRVARWLIEVARREGSGAGDDVGVKVFVDTAPVPEKPLGMAAGLGWQGKHANLVSRDLGNWFFIGSIFTTLDLPVDAREVDHCGNCSSCLTACPTNAFVAPYKLDARRCISYLTIEHKGPVQEDLRPLLGNHIYGCDDCLAACPWNKFAVTAREARYHARADLVAPRLAELAVLDEAAFRAFFAGSPVKRAGRGGFIRNVLYAIGNSGDAGLRNVAQGLCEDEDAVVRDAARWAVLRLGEDASGGDI